MLMKIFNAPLKMTCIALSLLLSAAAPLAAFQATPKWITFSPPKGGFSILMPAEPKEETDSKTDFTSHLYSASTDNAIYLAGFGDYAPSVRLDVQGELAANRDNFIKGLPQAKLLSSRNVTLEEHPGIEFTGENSQARFKSRIYLIGNRVYQIVALEFVGKDDTENVNRFFSSFAFTRQQP
jgi:hypothetical protein